MPGKETQIPLNNFVVPERTASFLYLSRAEMSLVCLEILQNTVSDLLKNPHLALKVFMDGVSAAGKGKILELLKELGIEVTSTGTIARAVTKYAIEMGYTQWNDLTEKEAKIKEFELRLKHIKISLELLGGETFVVVAETFAVGNERSQNENEESYFAKVRRYNARTDLGSSAVTSQISFIAGLDFVCDMLDETLISVAAAFRHVAVDGRDNLARKLATQEELAYVQRDDENINVKTFHAYFSADLLARQERAVQRRLDELEREGKVYASEDLERELAAVKAGVFDRDMKDIHRKRGNLIAPEVAQHGTDYDWFFDTTTLNIAEMQLLFLARLYAHILPEQGFAVFSFLEKYFADTEAEGLDTYLPEAQQQSEMLLGQSSDQNPNTYLQILSNLLQLSRSEQEFALAD